MTLTPIDDNQTICAVWNSRKEQSIAVRVSYQTLQQDGCKIFTIRKVEELD
jgi:hypothetical protein